MNGALLEHRNMPLADAVSFVARNFDTYLRDLREPPVATPYYPPAPSYHHPAPPPRRDYERAPSSYPDPYSTGSYGSSYSAYSRAPPVPASRQPVYSDNRQPDYGGSRGGMAVESAERVRSGPYEGERNYSSEILSNLVGKLKGEPGNDDSILLLQGFIR